MGLLVVFAQAFIVGGSFALQMFTDIRYKVASHKQQLGVSRPTSTGIAGQGELLRPLARPAESLAGPATTEGQTDQPTLNHELRTCL